MGLILNERLCNSSYVKEEKTIKQMTNEEFIDFCKSKGLTQQQIMIAECIYRKDLKGQDLYKAIGYSCRHTQRIRKQIHNLLNGTNVS